MFLWVDFNGIFINVVLVASLHSMCVWIIINQNLFGVLIIHKTTIILMSNIVSTQSINNFEMIFEHPGVKGFISIFLVDIIGFVSPDNHFPKIDFILYFKPFYDGLSDNVEIDEMVDQP